VSLASKPSIITSGYLSLFSFLNLKHSQKKKPTNTRPKMKCASILTSHINVLNDYIVHKKIYFSIYKKVLQKKSRRTGINTRIFCFTSKNQAHNLNLSDADRRTAVANTLSKQNQGHAANNEQPYYTTE